MDGYPAIALLLNAVEVSVDTWHDDRMPADRYGTLQKRSGAALVITVRLQRLVKSGIAGDARCGPGCRGGV